ncbi:hypothetical protein G6F35_004468 [Rhizopus arrhizus]|nr:hypothetical protein G6F35_004468 [Rhizopus arrhizus]
MSKQNKLKELNNIVAVFVVQFDVHKGNIIEWQYPADFNLEGVEYQAICSGLHNVDSDILYFSRQDKYYGISVFKNMPVDTSRGAYMKAIGILVKPTRQTGDCGEVWKHKDYLIKEINQHMVEEIEPERYENLMNYYNQYKYCENQVKSARTSWLNDKSLLYATEHSVNYNLIHNMPAAINQQELIKPNDFLDLLELLGDNIFVLWKASILKKRIMFMDDPKIGNSSGYVYCTHLMGHTPDKYKAIKPIIPKFIVGVNDISELEKSQNSFVACTPDTIFQIKSNLYDIALTFSSTHSSPYYSQIPTTTSIREAPNKRLLIKSNTHSVPAAANTADTKRYYILLDLLSLSNGDFNPMPIKTSSSSLITSFYYWLYEEEDETKREMGEEHWKDMFARKSSRSLSAHSSHSSSRRSGYTDDEDATEIDPNEICEVVAARVSNDLGISSNYFQQKYKPINNILINHNSPKGHGRVRIGSHTRL